MNPINNKTWHRVILVGDQACELGRLIEELISHRATETQRRLRTRLINSLCLSASVRNRKDRFNSVNEM